MVVSQTNGVRLELLFFHEISAITHEDPRSECYSSF